MKIGIAYALLYIWSNMLLCTSYNYVLLNDAAFLYSSELYSHLNLPETEISHFIEKTKNFISNQYNPKLFDEVIARIGYSLNKDSILQLKDVFEEFKNPFDRVDTTTKRMKLFKGLGLYVEPELNLLDEITKSTARLTQIKIQKRTINSYHIPLSHSLKQIFSIKGLFEATKNYVTFLESYRARDVYMNYIQGTLWKARVSQFDKKDGIVFPLHIFFDDVEMGGKCPWISCWQK